MKDVANFVLGLLIFTSISMMFFSGLGLTLAPPTNASCTRFTYHADCQVKCGCYFCHHDDGTGSCYSKIDSKYCTSGNINLDLSSECEASITNNKFYLKMSSMTTFILVMILLTINCKPTNQSYTSQHTKVNVDKIINEYNPTKIDPSTDISQ